MQNSDTFAICDSLFCGICLLFRSFAPSMDSTEEYAEFLKKVERTIYVDNISPAVTETVLKAAFNQFGNVTRVQFIPTFMQPNGVPQAALVEMETTKQAEQIISEMESCPFMIAGMPRPVRGKIAEVEMFDARPRKPGRKIRCRWLHPKDPKFEVAMKIKNLVKKHAAEVSFLLEVNPTFLHLINWDCLNILKVICSITMLLLQQQLAEEENLAKKQAETLRVNYKKLELIDGVFADGTAKHLARHYRIDAKDL